jgi:23S rRNA (uracil1939-C5)-methyltransferase/tRNA (uracil-5-)-methyltransferase
VSKNKKFHALPFAYHQEIELEISTLTNLGVGLGRVKLPGAEIEAGWVVMVPFALPGEQVRARVFRNHKNFSEADLVAVLQASPHRIPAPCPLFGRCGGCQYQQLAYAEQLAWKRRQVAELLGHMAGIEFPVEPVIGSPREFGYRSKITPHFAAPRSGVLDAANFPIGFLRQGTRFELVDVPRCEIATDAINELLPEVRARTREQAAAGAYPRGGTVLLRDAGGAVTTDYGATIVEEIGSPDAAEPGQAGLRLRFLARDFFQNNPFILPFFARYVTGQAAASGAR